MAIFSALAFKSALRMQEDVDDKATCSVCRREKIFKKGVFDFRLKEMKKSNQIHHGNYLFIYQNSIVKFVKNGVKNNITLDWLLHLLGIKVISKKAFKKLLFVIQMYQKITNLTKSAPLHQKRKKERKKMALKFSIQRLK